MTNHLPLDLLVADQNLCHTEIAGHLSEGTLSLFLGAGVGAGVGLPAWWKLVKACAKEAKIAAAIKKSTSPEKLMALTTQIETKYRPAEFHAIVRRNLYTSHIADETLLSHRLLAALGALCMNSRRGHVSEIVTLNFDDLLDRYLALHGFVTSVFSEIPALRPDSDVLIYHPHGYLPFSEDKKPSKKLIFSKLSFDEELGTRLNKWKEFVFDIVQRKVPLFVGLSANNSNLTAWLTALSDDVKSQRGVTGYWFLGPNDPISVDTEVKQRNIVPMRFPTYDDYPRALLRICQIAAKKA